MTTAFLGDERTLREFVVGDLVVSRLRAKGRSAELYLVNDSFDCLTSRQLRVGVNKDQGLIERFRHHCGRAISQIPDPFECHRNYAKHFEAVLIQRLHALEIAPTVVDSYEAYDSGRYDPYIRITFERYHEIQAELNQRFGRDASRSLFRVRCPSCGYLDATRIDEVKEMMVHFQCDRCGTRKESEVPTLRGKLSWKLDCAVRWNLYQIDVEVFSKAHVAEQGSFRVARFLSQTYYGGRVPSVIRYGDVTLSRELSFKLLEILPPPLFKKLLTANLTRDLHLTRESVEHFCRNYAIRPGVSYVDYIRKELPYHALCNQTNAPPIPSPSNVMAAGTLVAFGNRFSRLYYNKDYRICPPDRNAALSADIQTAELARQVIRFALGARNADGRGWEGTKMAIKAYLATVDATPGFYHFLRRLLGQHDGPNITTLLAILPVNLLREAETALTTTACPVSEEAA